MSRSSKPGAELLGLKALQPLAEVPTADSQITYSATGARLG